MLHNPCSIWLFYSKKNYYILAPRRSIHRPPRSNPVFRRSDGVHSIFRVTNWHFEVAREEASIVSFFLYKTKYHLLIFRTAALIIFIYVILLCVPTFLTHKIRNDEIHQLSTPENRVIKYKYVNLDIRKWQDLLTARFINSKLNLFYTYSVVSKSSNFKSCCQSLVTYEGLSYSTPNFFFSPTLSSKSGYGMQRVIFELVHSIC